MFKTKTGFLCNIVIQESPDMNQWAVFVASCLALTVARRPHKVCKLQKCSLCCSQVH